MDIQELRKQDIPALKERLVTLLKEHFELRMQHKTTQLTNSSKLGKTKRLIAQVKTIITEKSL